MMVMKVMTAIGLFLAVQIVHLLLVTRWGDLNTRGLSYYGGTRLERRRFRWLLRAHRVALTPILALLAITSRCKFSQRGFTYQGMAAPRGACSLVSFQQAERFEPGPEDVFVVSQMRSGTTWMQHLAYQVVTRGTGELPEKALNALSPWLESFRTVSVQEAPRVGLGRSSRLIKTHLPRTLCPFSPQAKYIYVVRHPLSCFASCVDFVRHNLRGFEPSIEEFENWFCSDDLMWWNTWVEHVSGWWQLAEGEDNLLFVRFEDMVDDLPSVAQRVAAFLGVHSLGEDETQRVLTACRFSSMKKHADAFEMHPPHLLQRTNALFVSGKKNRRADIPADVRQRVGDWCREACTTAAFPVKELYPDLQVVRDAETRESVLCTF
jgi:hypothetical protein